MPSWSPSSVHPRLGTGRRDLAANFSFAWAAQACAGLRGGGRPSRAVPIMGPEPTAPPPPSQQLPTWTLAGGAALAVAGGAALWAMGQSGRRGQRPPETAFSKDPSSDKRDFERIHEQLKGMDAPPLSAGALREVGGAGPTWPPGRQSRATPPLQARERRRREIQEEGLTNFPASLDQLAAGSGADR